MAEGLNSVPGLAHRTRSVLQSTLERLMSRTSGRLFFFFFPRPLAEGIV
jgi:hypothetical protein